MPDQYMRRFRSNCENDFVAYPDVIKLMIPLCAYMDQQSTREFGIIDNKVCEVLV